MSTSNAVKASFEPNVFTLPLAVIEPLRQLPDSLRTTQKYKQIAASLKHVGLIEPLVLYQAGPGRYWLLDGHLRLDILKAEGFREARCLFAKDDEAYTYNRRVNYLPAIAEHFMILKAINNGVPEERIADALSVDVSSIKKKRSLLDGICPEAVALLRDRRITGNMLSVLRKLKPIRQVEAAELMIAASNYTVKYAKTLLLATHSESLAITPKNEKLKGISPAQKALMEQESENLLKDLKAAEVSYGSDILILSVSCRYFEKLLSNVQIKRFLSKHHSDMLQELERLLAEVNSGRSRKQPSASVPVARRSGNKSVKPA